MRPATIRRIIISLQAVAPVASLAVNLGIDRYSSLREGYSVGDIIWWKNFCAVWFFLGLFAWGSSVTLALCGLKRKIFKNNREKFSFGIISILFTPFMFIVVQIFMPITLK
ncbi:hypothetical protein [Massilia scottii]|uniref:hypothetical protein n=1 Tax=Massilia scottii TaxID=3057166 RepID=UPI0027969937|nr:hypothetical protein [Massilia sp. CCM 9029]MDQ1835623.1 hypothetical protein [Massilia sp. CCM 9029]